MIKYLIALLMLIQAADAMAMRAWDGSLPYTCQYEWTQNCEAMVIQQENEDRQEMLRLMRQQNELMQQQQTDQEIRDALERLRR